jgi:hypothetical protein
MCIQEGKIQGWERPEKRTKMKIRKRKRYHRMYWVPIKAIIIEVVVLNFLNHRLTAFRMIMHPSIAGAASSGCLPDLVQIM